MKSNFQHRSLASGRWYSLTLAEQLGNIGSEINRAIQACGEKIRFERAVERGLELFDLTLNDPRWYRRLKEIARARELFCCAVLGVPEYNTSLEDLNRYFYYFALAARSQR